MDTLSISDELLLKTRLYQSLINHSWPHFPDLNIATPRTTLPPSLNFSGNRGNHR